MKEGSRGERDRAKYRRHRSRPPRINGISTARPADAFRIVWWYQRGLLYISRHGPPLRRLLTGLTWVGSWLCWPLLVLAKLAYIAHPTTHVYITAGATLSIRVKRYSWRLEDHISRHLGSGQGKSLRQQLLPALLAHVDAHRIPLEASAATYDLALLYMRELPRLRSTGRDWMGGWKLRLPATAQPAETITFTE